MKRLDKMHSILSQALRPIKIKIIDDSDLHVGHAEASGVGETHFRIEIISEGDLIFLLTWINSFNRGIPRVTFDFALTPAK